MDKFRSFFHFQHHALGILWRWGLVSVVVGAVLTVLRNPLFRNLGIQSLTWGAIDALLAFFGRRDALSKINSDLADPTEAARKLRTILLVNAALDVGYLATGTAMTITGTERPARRGSGLGVIIQGLFLLIYDLWFADKTRYWLK
jgi:hypothetical protein